ncbi:hypothetical protein DIPPA_35757 [Diplonema papillatum]|nr:hypothetical protein DIPPA_14959 [Diplonema papillatum]KAJ9442928.1 hypothetical protein DIPPA_35757 [Diplonema papillatum]
MADAFRQSRGADETASVDLAPWHDIEITGKERLDMYSVRGAVILYNVACLAVTVAMIVWIAIQRNPRDEKVLVIEGTLSLVVAMEATVRILIVGRRCCKYVCVWLDATLCYACLVLFLASVLVPYLALDETELEEEAESAAAVILLAVRFALQVVRVGILCCRNAFLLRKTRDFIALEGGSSHVPRSDRNFILDPRASLRTKDSLTSLPFASLAWHRPRDSVRSPECDHPPPPAEEEWSPRPGDARPHPLLGALKEVETVPQREGTADNVETGELGWGDPKSHLLSGARWQRDYCTAPYCSTETA